MRRNHLWVFALLLSALAVALGVLAWPAVRLQADAAATAQYTLDWWTLDGGGQTSVAGSDYTLEGTIGQPDAVQWVGGRYSLSGGFWVLPRSAAMLERVYLPLVMR